MCSFCVLEILSAYTYMCVYVCIHVHIRTAMETKD